MNNNNINNSIKNNIKNERIYNDLLLLGNSGCYNKEILENYAYDDLKEDFNKYKKDIKLKINELYTSYLDVSGNNILENVNNSNEKYINYFNLFIKNLLEELKIQEMKKSIQDELRIYKKNKKINKDFSNNQFSKNDLLEINKELYSINAENNSNKNKNKNINNQGNLDNFIIVKNINLKKPILPKKRN